MKRLFPLLLALLLLVSAACSAQVSPSPRETDSATPAVPAETGPEAPPSPSAPQAQEEKPAEPPFTPISSPVPEDSRFFIVDGHFLGAWHNGTWYSAHETGFTLGQIFNRTYTNCLTGEEYTSACFYVGEGPGGYENFSDLSPLLSSLGPIENKDLTLSLPAALSGEAAALPAPDYSFNVRFDGVFTFGAVSNGPIAALRHTESAPPMKDTLASALLEAAGIRCTLDRVWRSCWAVDLDSDGEPEQLEFIRNRETDSGNALVDEGEPVFYALFLTDGDETELITSNFTYDTADLTAHFALHNLSPFYDLDGDGTYEITFLHYGWEGGHYAAFTRTDTGWTEVLRANYGT